MMQRNIIDLPCGLFGPLVSDWVINVRGKSAGEGVTGEGQVVYGNQPRWEAILTLSGFKGQRVMAWRAIRARMRGRVNLLRVCVCDAYSAGWGKIGVPPGDIGLLKGDGVPHGDDAGFDDGTGYGQVPTILVPVTLAAGSESITVDATSVNGTLQPGNFFSHDDWLYQVTGIEGGVAETTLWFEPPLRRPIPAGEEISCKATALMVFDSDLEGRMPLQLNRHGEAEINLKEWVSRP